MILGSVYHNNLLTKLSDRKLEFLKFNLFDGRQVGRTCFSFLYLPLRKTLHCLLALVLVTKRGNRQITLNLKGYNER